mgnify:CR=1 FL=1
MGVYNVSCPPFSQKTNAGINCFQDLLTFSVKCSQFVNLWDSQLYSGSCPKLSNWEKLFSTRQCSALVYSFSSSTYEQAAAAIHTHTQLTLYVRAAQLITMAVYWNFVPKLILGQIGILCMYQIVNICKKYRQFIIQVNLCQKHLFSHQLTHNMTKDWSLIYLFNT